MTDRLQQPLPGLTAQERMSGRVLPTPLVPPDNARRSAVLVLFFPVKDQPYVLLIKRVEDGKVHSGQISFPGGSTDRADASLMHTALREAYEETGIDRDAVQVIGSMSPLYIPVSNFQVFPFLGYLPEKPTNYQLSEQEVERVLEVPVDRLFRSGNKEFREIRPATMPQMILRVPVYKLDQDNLFVWGATAMMLSELEVIWTGNGW